jgi:ABC-type sugar transport system ATPase subunit
MQKADSANAETYAKSATDYIAKLVSLDKEFQAVVDNGVRREILIGDRFPFRYFADSYGLEYYAAFVGCSTETEASATTIAFLIDKSAYEVVLSGRLGTRGIMPFYLSEDKKAARENLEKLGISDLANRCYRELSGGQQQRVLLARALCATKKLLLLDEPVAGLDPVVTRELYTMIEQINFKTGLTIIMVSHDIESAVKYASHINRQRIFRGDLK